MADTVYEGMFLLDSNRYGRDPEGVSGQIPAMIQAVGGEVLVSRMWEERRLAYPIRGRRKGTYWLTYFRVGGAKLTELRRQSGLNDNILRALFIKVDPRIVDTLVEHAQAGSIKSASDRSAARHGRPTEGEAKPADQEAEPAEDQAKPAKEEAAAESQDSQEPPSEAKPQ